MGGPSRGDRPAYHITDLRSAEDEIQTYPAFVTASKLSSFHPEGFIRSIKAQLRIKIGGLRFLNHRVLELCPTRRSTVWNHHHEIVPRIVDDRPIHVFDERRPQTGRRCRGRRGGRLQGRDRSRLAVFADGLAEMWATRPALGTPDRDALLASITSRPTGSPRGQPRRRSGPARPEVSRRRRFRSGISRRAGSARRRRSRRGLQACASHGPNYPAALSERHRAARWRRLGQPEPPHPFRCRP